MKKYFLGFLFVISISLTAQNVYRTRVFDSSIKTLKSGVRGEKFGLPVFELNSDNILDVSFDEMSHNIHSYSYTVLHCNADWTPSSLNSNEYLSGYTTGNITDYTLSVNTTFLYTHYKLSLPNDDMSFKISGNYVLLIYEDNQVEKPVAQLCFSVFEPRISFSATVRGNTDTELSGKYQQLDFDINMNGCSVRDAASEVKVIVRQNNRIDNEVTDLKPTFISGSKLSYINNKELIFEGGNEYYRFDISSVYAAGEGVERVQYNQPGYDAFLYPSKILDGRPYMQEPDVNGRFVINLQKSDDDAVEADYMDIHFSIPTEQPFFDGQLYIGGDLNYNLTDKAVQLNYNATDRMYEKSVLLKQGGYSYQYWFVPKGKQQASVERIHGSHWQARNEYTIYVYHRAWGERYDKLVGVKTVE